MTRGLGISLAAAWLASASAVTAQEAPILLPGAPGQDTRAVTQAEAIKLSDTRYAAGDVAFMQGMIAHHQQAVDMAALVNYI